MRSSTLYLSLAFLISIALLIGVGSYWYSTFQNWNQANQFLEHNHAILQSTEKVLSLLKDIEVGQRGYIITRDSTFLTPFQFALVDMPKELKHLDSLLAKTPTQRHNMIKLEAFVKKRTYYAQRALNVAIASTQLDTQAVHDLMKTGKATMDSTRVLIADMKNREMAIIPKLNLFKVKAAIQSTIALVVSFGLSFALFAGTFFKMVQEFYRRLKTEKLLLRNLTELQRSYAQLDDFNYVSVHHLQEPLRKLNIFSDRLQQKHLDELSPEVQFLVQKLRTAAGEISHLIQDLTTYTTLGKSPEQQSFADTPLESILQKVTAEFSEEIKAQGVEVKWSEELPIVEGNAEQLRLLFSHLLSNSLKFAKGDEPLRVDVEATTVSGFLIPGVADADHDYTFQQINFTDNGIGIDKKHADVIFELFQRLHKDKDMAGTGIGLAICKKIMLNHNGYISLKSDLNRGTTFSLFFPL